MQILARRPFRATQRTTTRAPGITTVLDSPSAYQSMQRLTSNPFCGASSGILVVIVFLKSFYGVRTRYSSAPRPFPRDKGSTQRVAPCLPYRPDQASTEAPAGYGPQFVSGSLVWLFAVPKSLSDRRFLFVTSLLDQHACRLADRLLPRWLDKLLMAEPPFQLSVVRPLDPEGPLFERTPIAGGVNRDPFLFRLSFGREQSARHDMTRSICYNAAGRLPVLT